MSGGLTGDMKMKVLKRIRVGVMSSLDRVARQVENHEAMVNLAMQEVSEAGARAKVQLGRVKKDGQSMKVRIAELKKMAAVWKERALEVARDDEQRAIECLKRNKRAEEERAALEEQAREHEKIEKQLGKDLVVIEQKLRQIKEQKNLLRTRESRAEALQVVESCDSSFVNSVEDIFDRWDTKVTEYELRGSGINTGKDDFEEEFVTAEEEQELKDELSFLLKEASK